MKAIPFETLYNTEFFISEPMAKPQYWAVRGNVFNAMGKPKISHTLVWFKNCSATITDSFDNILEVKQNQIAYMAKGTEYIVHFHNTNLSKEDTIVIHFQMTDKYGNDIIPVSYPIVCINDVTPSIALSIDILTEEFKKNIVCFPQISSEIYKILALICQKQKKYATKNKYACIKIGIELLEQNSNLPMYEIAKRSGVSVCYFRKLFKEYSGQSPMEFRQNHRIKRAKQLLLLDENYTIEEIARELNFSDIYHFSKNFKKFCGVSPRKYILENSSKKHS